MAKDRIRQQTVVTQTMDKIREIIINGAYSPGDRIPTEKELAERFGIGRSSIREAIKIFNYLGVLDSRAALGTFVCERSSIATEALSWSLFLGDDEVEELIDLRGSIELWSILSLVAAVRKRDAAALETISRLDQILSEMETSAREGRRKDLIESDFAFHQTIIHSTNNKLFASLYQTLRSFLYGEIQYSQDNYEDPAQICVEHRTLLQIFAGGDTVLALAAYTDHIASIKRSLRDQALKRRSKATEPTIRVAPHF